MLTVPQSRWGLRLATFVAWALAAACAMYWGLRLGTAPAGPVAAVVAPAAAAVVDPERVARFLGAVPAAAAAATPVAPASSRFALVGVVAGVSQQGAALIAVDGKPAKPYRVGASVDGNLVLQSVGPRQATLAPAMDAPAAFTLEMPLRPGAGGAAAGGPAPTRYAGAPPTPMPAPVPSPTPAPAAANPAAAPGMSPQAEAEQRRAFGRLSGSRSNGEAAAAPLPGSAPAQ
jgi:general secretion pathway protein C